MVRDSKASHALGLVVSQALDSRLNTHVDGCLDGHAPPTTANSPGGAQEGDSGRTTQLLEETASGATALLRRWPDQARLLQACFGRPLPDRLRQAAWALLLDSRARTDECLRLLASRATAKHDADIARRCEALLQEPGFAELLPDRTALVPLMRCALAFWLAVHGSLRSSDIRLTVPLCCAFRRVGGADRSLSPRDREAAVAARFCRLLELCAVSRAPAEDTATAALALLREHDAALHAALAALQASPGGGGGSGGGDFAAQLATMVKPLFAGHLPVTTVLYAWDCVVLAFTAPQYDCMGALLAAVLLCLRQSLLACTDAAAACTALREGAATLPANSLQRAVEETFLTEMRRQLASASATDMAGSAAAATNADSASAAVAAAALAGSYGDGGNNGGGGAWRAWLPPADATLQAQAQAMEAERSALVAEHEAAMAQVRRAEAVRLAAVLRQQEELRAAQEASEERLGVEQQRVAELKAAQAVARQRLEAQRVLRRAAEDTLLREADAAGAAAAGVSSAVAAASGYSKAESQPATPLAEIKDRQRSALREQQQQADQPSAGRDDQRSRAASNRNSEHWATEPTVPPVDVRDANSVLLALLHSAMVEVRSLTLQRA